MKLKIYLLFFSFVTTLASAQSLQTFHDFSAVKINGDTLNLSTFAGSKVLVVNTASYCMYTPQYAVLEQLYLMYGGTGFTILGFPCNDFGGQEPGDNAAIDSFCSAYNVTFQMMEKISITAPDTAEVYKWLQLQARNGVANAPVLWNFQKFMIDEAGHWHACALSAVSPLDTSITNWINSPSVLGVAENKFLPDKAVVIPNPVHREAVINLSSHRNAHINIQLFSKEGVLIKTLYDAEGSAAAKIPFDAGALASGIYLLRVALNGEVQTLKIAVIK